MYVRIAVASLGADDKAVSLGARASSIRNPHFWFMRGPSVLSNIECRYEWKPVFGDRLLELSIGRGSGALKGLKETERFSSIV